MRRLRLEGHLLWTVLSTLVVLNLVCFAWVFFRASSFSDAVLLIGNMVQIGESTDLHEPWTASLGTPSAETTLALGLIALVAAVHVFREYPQRVVQRIGQNPLVRWVAYLLLVLAILNLGLSQDTPFVYLQF